MGKYIKALTILLVSSLLVLLLVLPVKSETTTTDNDPNYNLQYQLFNQRLYVSIQPSLYAHYSNMSHTINCDSNYSQLVTPEVVQPIADSLWKIVGNLPNSDEQFANAVLSFVHQIPYKVSGVNYPVETLVNNCGDCGGLSLLAASIMKAGGLDVVLIKYVGVSPGHMNVGVCLSHAPVYHNLLMTPTSYEYDNKTYWTAEATSNEDWRVGDQSLTSTILNAVVVPLDSYEQSSPGQVSANFGKPLPASSITINVYQQPVASQNEKRALVISGSIEPADANRSVTLYLNNDNSNLHFSYTITDVVGEYSYLWNIPKDGTYYVTASLRNNQSYAGGDSETLIVCIGPESLQQFQTPNYSYIIGNPVADFAIRPYVGINDFLQIPLKTNVSLSYDFIVLTTGQPVSQVEVHQVTIPAADYTIRTGNRQNQVFHLPERTMTVPVIPAGLQPLILSDGFNDSINNNFCLIIQNNQNDSYSLNAKGLNANDLSSIKQDNENSTFVNATQSIQDSTWYTVTSVISNNAMTTDIKAADGTPLDNLSAASNIDGKQLVMYIANNVNSAVVLKDLKITSTNAAVNQPKTVTPQPGETSGMPLYFYAIALVAVTIACAAVFVVKKQKSAEVAETVFQSFF
jgi:hypothetical protein